mgnify:CR=1 FL=1
MLTQVLTAAGIKFCAALLGVAAPSYDACNTAIWRVGVSCDRWGRCPTYHGSMPDGSNPGQFKEIVVAPGYSCLTWARYDTIGGGKGSSYFCWRPARFVFDLVTATYYWELEEPR